MIREIEKSTHPWELTELIKLFLPTTHVEPISYIRFISDKSFETHFMKLGELAGVPEEDMYVKRHNKNFLAFSIIGMDTGISLNQFRGWADLVNDERIPVRVAEVLSLISFDNINDSFLQDRIWAPSFKIVEYSKECQYFNVIVDKSRYMYFDVMREYGVDLVIETAMGNKMSLSRFVSNFQSFNPLKGVYVISGDLKTIQKILEPLGIEIVENYVSLSLEKLELKEQVKAQNILKSAGLLVELAPIFKHSIINWLSEGKISEAS